MQGAAEITLDDVVRAGRTLYGPAFAADAGGWRDTLKATYRRRAMETHPDRARSIGRSERELAREFKAVADAYRILSTLGRAPLPRGRAPSAAPPRAWTGRPAERAGARRASPAARPPPPPPTGARASPFRVRVAVRPQDLPRRKLRFAEYLYYSGRVAWSDLVDAIAWQRAQRPPLGRIAVDFGYLSPEDVALLLDRRRVAAASGIPQYFVERGLLDPDDIDLVRTRILRHNAKY